MISYEQAVGTLLSLGFELKAGKFFLEGIRVLMAAMGNPLPIPLAKTAMSGFTP